MTARLALLLATVFSLPAGGLLAQEKKADDARGLLERCLASQAVLDHVSMGVSSDIEFTEMPAVDRPRRQGGEHWFRRDGQRLSMVGKSLAYDNQTGQATKPQSFRSVISDGRWSLFGSEKGPKVITKKLTREWGNLLQNVVYGLALDGYFPGDDGNRIGQYMVDAKDLRVAGQEESIDGVPCRVVEATTKYGRIRQWIAPSRGYAALKVVCEKGPNDIYYGGKTVAEFAKEAKLGYYDGQTVVGLSFVLDGVKVSQIGEVYVPHEGTLTQRERLSRGRDCVQVFKYRYVEIELNPTFAEEIFSHDSP